MADQIKKQIDIAATQSRVWRALTDSGEFGAWFLVKMEGPFVAGQTASGRITHPGYEHVRMEIAIQAIEPETLFSFTWHPYAVDPTTDFSQEQPTLVEFRLEPTAQGTRLTVTESGFEHLPPHRQDEAFRKNDGGWAQQVKNIERYVGQNA